MKDANMKPLELLNIPVTRWGYAYQMLDRFLVVKAPLKVAFNRLEAKDELGDLMYPTENTWEFLQAVHLILKSFHDVCSQSCLMSA